MTTKPRQPTTPTATDDRLARALIAAARAFADTLEEELGLAGPTLRPPPPAARRTTRIYNPPVPDPTVHVSPEIQAKVRAMLRRKGILP